MAATYGSLKNTFIFTWTMYMSALDFAKNNLFKIGQSKKLINSNPFARNPTIIVYLIRFAPEIKKKKRL